MFHDAVDRCIFEIQFGQFQKTQFRQPRELKAELQNTADKNRPSQRGNGRIEIRHEKQREYDKRHVQERGRKRRNAEFMIGIEY